MLKFIAAILLIKKLNERSKPVKEVGSEEYGSAIRTKQSVSPCLPEVQTKLTFNKKLHGAGAKTKEIYRQLTEFCESLGLRRIEYKHKQKFVYKGKTVANLGFTHKSLRLCVALAPETAEACVPCARDLSAYIKHRITPLGILLKTYKALECAKNMLTRAKRAV